MHRKVIPYLDKIENILEGRFEPPLSCEIDPSNKCQNNCDFCMYADYRNEHPVDLDFGVYLDLIHDLRKMGTRSITFTGGGEPMMHPQFREMVLAAQDFELGLTTNGVYLDHLPDIINMFKFVRISLDAATSETYKAMKGTNFFERVVENAKRTVRMKRDMVLGLSYVISKGNEHEIEAAQKLADDIGVDYIQIKPAYQKYDLECKIPKGDKSFILKRYSSSGRLPCAIAHLVGIVGADENVYFCCQGRGREDFVVGDLARDSFLEIWKRRMKMRPSCGVMTCRYMNYAKGYEMYGTQKHTVLRHHNFL